MILAIVGPTGVGKTKLSIELAKKYNAIIINCDAVQIYQELNIGSAKATLQERENIPHKLLDFVNPNTFYTVYDYQKDAREILEQNKDKNIIFVGGTGLYLKAALYDYKFLEENATLDYDNKTNEELYKLALKKDKNCAIHPNNRQRLIRFLKRKQTIKEPAKLLQSVLFIGLTTERNKLYEIINQRVEKMLDAGLVDEVKELLKKYPNAHILNTAIGYKEIKDYLENKITLEEAIELIQKNSRHYAKRQYTYFNHQLPVTWFNVDYANFSNTIQEVINFIEKDKE